MTFFLQLFTLTIACKTIGIKYHTSPFPASRRKKRDNVSIKG